VLFNIVKFFHILFVITAFGANITTASGRLAARLIPRTSRSRCAALSSSTTGSQTRRT
jgi:hypothetical protein